MWLSSTEVKRKQRGRDAKPYIYKAIPNCVPYSMTLLLDQYQQDETLDSVESPGGISDAAVKYPLCWTGEILTSLTAL